MTFTAAGLLRWRLVAMAIVLGTLPVWPGCTSGPEVEWVVLGEPPEGVYAFGFSRLNPDSHLPMDHFAGNADLAAYEAALTFTQGYRFGAPDAQGQWSLSPARDFGTNRLAMAEITSRDILEMREREFMVSQLYIPMDYNFSAELMRAFETASQYRVFIEVEHTDAGARQGVPEQAVQAALAKHFADNDDDSPGGTAWITVMQPQMSRTREVGEGRVDLYINEDVRLESLAGGSTLRYRVELFICDDFFPEDMSRLRSPDPITPETPPDYRPRITGGGAIPEDKGMGFGIVFSPPGSPELPYSAKEEAEARALEFLPYMTHGFRFDIEEGTFELLATRHPDPGPIRTVAWYGSASRSFYTAQLLADRVLEVPSWGVTRVPVEVEYVYDPEDERLLDDLPRILAVRGLAAMGAQEGIGFFGGDFQWDYNVEERHRVRIQATLHVFRESAGGGIGPGGRAIPPGTANIPGGQTNIPPGQGNIPGGRDVPGDDSD